MPGWELDAPNMPSTAGGVGFSQFVAGLVALANSTHREARSLFQESIPAFDQVRQRENRGWVLGPMALAARG